MASRFIKTKLGIGKPQSAYRIFGYTLSCVFNYYIYTFYICAPAAYYSGRRKP